MQANLPAAIPGADPAFDVLASGSHEAIVVPLLVLVFFVSFCGVLFGMMVRHYLRQRGLLAGGTGARRADGADREAGNASSRPVRWLAIRSTSPQRVLASLGLHNPTPCYLEEGLPRLGGRRLFISPPLGEWVLVLGSRLPDTAEDVDACFRFLHRLSRDLGEVQFFSMDPMLGRHGWAVLEEGRVKRGYAWAGGTLWNEGEATTAERRLGMRCYSYLEGHEPATATQVAAAIANAEKIPSLAAALGLDLAALETTAAGATPGIVGEFGPGRRR